ncbi:MAG: hypothetical protein GU347_04615 [Desulfurococcales archaeon]|jgi:hypothetical protein|nr:hypothetical protein [Desulfurococcales archaeon]
MSIKRLGKTLAFLAAASAATALLLSIIAVILTGDKRHLAETFIFLVAFITAMKIKI